MYNSFQNLPLSFFFFEKFCFFKWTLATMQEKRLELVTSYQGNFFFFHCSLQNFPWSWFYYTKKYQLRSHNWSIKMLKSQFMTWSSFAIQRTRKRIASMVYKFFFFFFFCFFSFLFQNNLIICPLFFQGKNASNNMSKCL